jgi:hypothetical protein
VYILQVVIQQSIIYPGEITSLVRSSVSNIPTADKPQNVVGDGDAKMLD